VSGRAKLTYRDWEEIPDDLLQHEIIDGEHYSARAPCLSHQLVFINLIVALFDYAEERGACIIPRMGVVLSDYDVVIPDLIYLGDACAPFIRDRIFGRPDLIIEILDEGRVAHDEVVKRQLYERFSISEYWIVDPEDLVVNVYRLDGRAFQSVAEFHADDMLTSPTLPGLKVPLAEVFARVRLTNHDCRGNIVS